MATLFWKAQTELKQSVQMTKMMGAGSDSLWALTELCADQDEIGEHGDVAQRDDEAHHVPSVLPSDRHDPEPDCALLALLRLVRDRELAQPLCAGQEQ